MFSDAEIKRLLDVANAGCHHGRVAEARQVYEGVLAVKPGFLPARIGQALSHVVVNEFEEAERIIMDDVLKTAPDDAEARALLGLSYLLSGRGDEAAELLRAVSDVDGPAGEMARGLLAQAG